MHQTRPFLAVALTSGLLAPGLHAAVQPYASADAYTVHLYHCNEAAGGSATANAGTAGLSAYTVDANPVTGAVVTTVLGGTGYAGFGNALDFTGKTDHLAGFDANNSGGFQTDQSNAILSPDRVAFSTLGLGGTNPFTLEAMVNVASATGNREIICTDSSAANRGFQFRITTGGTTGQRLEFNQITGGAQRFGEIPNSGTHAFATGTWFHAAFVFDGTNCQFYWTKVDPAIASANPVGGAQATTFTAAVGGYDGPVAIANENRAVAAEGITGLIDEVRISTTARGAGDFIFFADTDSDGLPDAWETAHSLDPNSNAGVNGAAGDPDLDGASNLAEYQAGSDPQNINSTPTDLDGDHLLDSWEKTHFGNITSQDGSGDPDNDYATNEDEETAGTDPSGTDGFTSFPDSDHDGLSDGWENFRFSDLSQTASGDPDGDLYTNAEEYTAGTDPTQQLSASDSDADGLNDGWEALYFHLTGESRATTLAKQTGTGDPDGDHYSNEAEETASTNPTTAQKPSDLDADGLIDSWEMFYFSNLDQTATGNPDGDSGNNLAEQAAGSNPTLATSTVTDIDGDAVADSAEAFHPYTADSNTLHLWHLDEIDQPAADAGSNAVTMTTLNDNGRLWAPSLAGFATGLNPSAGRGTTTGGVLSALPLVNGTADDTTMTYMGASGAFTFEGIVRIDFDPTVAPSSVNPMQIVTGESDAGATRVWQFRIVPVGGPGNTAGTAPLLEFINLHGETAIQSLSVALPTSGDPDAIVQGGWYHVAVAYNGSEATADNLKLYFTLLNPSRTEANEVFSGQMTNDLITATPDFTIGNEGRDLGGSSDSFLGVVDEIRISDIARSPSQFLFTSGSGDTDGDGLPDSWETTYFGSLSENAAGDFERDGTDNLTEYRLGLIPNNGSSRFVASRTNAGVIQWPSVTGVTFKIERSTTLSGWSTLEAAFPGTAGTASYTDPAPPAGKAFYKITLNP